MYKISFNKWNKTEINHINDNHIKFQVSLHLLGDLAYCASVGIMQHQENHSIVSLSCIVINWSRPKLSNITNAKVCCSVLMSNSKCNPLFTRHVQFLSISTNAKWHLPLGKGGLISEIFTLWLESPKRGDKLRFRCILVRGVIWLLFSGD